jgi:hypothetical protein
VLPSNSSLTQSILVLLLTLVVNSSSNRRGHRKIPVLSYSRDAVVTAFLNVMGRQLSSVQEKRGDVQPKRARDLVMSGVRSESPETDLKVIEDKLK